MPHPTTDHSHGTDQPENVAHVPVIRHGRYRLDDFIEREAHIERWRAYDQQLHRIVEIHIVSRQHPNFEAVQLAAHRAGAVVDRRIVRVIDVVPDEDDLCIVSEWVVGLPLDEFIHSPLNPQHSASLTQSVVEALIALSRTDFDRRGSAEDWGHGRVTPQSVIVNPNGEVRLRGHLVQAALYGTVHGSDFAAEDIDSVGAVFEACLTARWPADVTSLLEAAPTDGTEYALPGQLRAWLPKSIDQFVAHTRIGPNQHQHLNEVRLGLLSIKQELPDDSDGTLSNTTDEGSNRTQWLRVGMGVAAGVVAVGLLGMGAAAVFQSPDSEFTASSDGSDPGASPLERPTTQQLTEAAGSGPIATTERALQVVAAWGFGEQPKRLTSTKTGAFAHDEDITTGWRTGSYSSAVLGNSTVEGLLIDLGSAQSVSAFNLDLIGSDSDLVISTGTKNQLLQGKGAEFGSVEHAPNNLVVRKARPVSTRFAAIQFTKLPLGADGYQGGILTVKVMGQ